jgi:hypothetical protein
MKNMIESEDSDIRLHNPTLKELSRACEDLCHKLRVPYDPYKIRVTTDYGAKVVIYYDGGGELL